MNRMDLIYSPDDYIAELKEELRMRRNVWRKISSQPLTFIMSEHQDRYDIMNELLQLLEAAGAKRIQLLQSSVIRENTPPPELFD